MRILSIIFIIAQILSSQQNIEAQLKCSRGNLSRSFLNTNMQQTVAQGDYDVTFYDIDLKIDPNLRGVHGVVGITGKSLIQSLDKVEIDMYSGLTIESVKNNLGENLSNSRNSNLLTVALNTPKNENEIFTIIIKYNGQPQNSGKGSFGFNTYNGQSMIWSLSEPYGARDWWPCKDTPNDKADSVDISLEVPTGLIAASNGKLVNTIANGDWTTFHWQERYPIATYLVSVAIHPYYVHYDKYERTPIDTMRLEYYLFNDSVPTNYGLTKNMLGAMESRFGDYPFFKEKYGHADFTWGGGMEHQTLTSMGGHSESLIAHELGHQWWGDMVTCANFHHIWLNEGLAEYAEALWYEKRDNNIQSLHNMMDNNKNWYGFRSGTIFVSDTTNDARIFNGSLTYAKASWIPHMLRHIVGDDNFFNGLKEYGRQYRFKSAVTEQFQAVMEEVSNMDLEAFFQRWIYGEFYPIYDVVYNQVGNKLLLNIDQIQNSPRFNMPIDIKAIFNDNSEQSWVVQDAVENILHRLTVDNSKTVKSIEFDPDSWVLKQINNIEKDITLLDTISSPTIPGGFRLYPVYPNPFNAETTIRFNLESGSEVELNIYDLNGNRVWNHKSEYLAGTQFIKWDGKDQLGKQIPSGTYIVKASNGSLSKTTKISLLK